MYGDQDYERGRGYGYDDGDREQVHYRGQSGSQAGNHAATRNTNYQNQQGGNRGYWGDFERGGQYGGRDGNYDTQSPRFGSESDRNYGRRDYGEQSWGRDQSNQQSGWNTQQGFGGQQRGPHAGKGPQGFQRSDERIKEMVHEALTDHEHLDATHITVEVKGGEVVMTGTVEDRNAKRLAEDIVERVSGVTEVQNQLRVSTSTNTSYMTPTSGNDKKTTKPS
jgi:osmotically-inducible protein OsmY